MDGMLTYLLIAFVTLVLGFLAGRYIQLLRTKSGQSALAEREKQLHKHIQTLEERLDKSIADNQELGRQKEELGLQLVRYQADMDNLRQKNQEQKEEVEKLQEKFTKEFENLANKILEEKSSKFAKQNKESLENILNPLKEKIKTFEDKVEKTHKESIDYHAALRQQIFGLKELNEQMSREATNLTKALKGDSKMQGNWGELVLERVLEKSGLEKDREYSVQKSFTLEDGSRVLPDVIINLPDGKKMIVDSKVSLTDYERYVNAEDDLRPKFLQDHVSSIKKHVSELSSKKYEELYEMESPDFVLMFVPIEPAFALAINHDNMLYNQAFEKNIVIVTPSTLLATLRTIDSMWNNEKQQRNAIEIARQAGALYDKFEGFITDLTKVGRKMDEAKREYQGAMNKLVEGRGNIVTSIEKLKKMGAKAKKSLPDPILKRAEEDEFDQEPELEL
ncbi:MAG: DNA recombination protein RmuC [Eudoraea sp.]|nr:DNA recombination protein RmuC [Eudoraea sp.]NNJ39500.1 DNA recombination protein RmuC [Eudoraea sp.]